MTEAPPTDHSHRKRAREGLLAGLGAYLIWGFVAMYFDYLHRRGVSAEHILAYRIAWSAFFLAILITVLRQWEQVWACLRSRRSLLALIGSTTLISINWYTYIYAVATHQLSHASLGYYMNPLVNVLLGVALLRERLRLLQFLAIALAVAGVTCLTVAIGKPPWIALSLAISFGLYGLLRKTMPAGAMAGLMVETAIVTPVCLAFLAWPGAHATGPRAGLDVHALLALSGIITATPLLLFALAARRLRLTTLGFLQFSSPTLQFLIAVWYFGEPFTKARQVTFAFIWAAVIVFLLDQLRAARASARLEPIAVEA